MMVLALYGASSNMDGLKGQSRYNIPKVGAGAKEAIE